MTSESFTKYWQKTYLDCPPIGYFLREAYPDIWFRIHTLPFSKRYADNKQEEKEILRRHNLLLSDLLSEGGKYILITTGYSPSLSPVHSYPQLDDLVKNREYLFSIPKHEFEMIDDPNYWHFFMTEGIWKNKSLDALLTLVANEEVSNILLVRVEQNCIYHPYDGGADIFIKDDLKRDLLKNKYSNWFSQHPSGL